jgi:hypothetical protein
MLSLISTRRLRAMSTHDDVNDDVLRFSNGSWTDGATPEHYFYRQRAAQTAWEHLLTIDPVVRVLEECRKDSEVITEKNTYLVAAAVIMYRAASRDPNNIKPLVKWVRKTVLPYLAKHGPELERELGIGTRASKFRKRAAKKESA